MRIRYFTHILYTILIIFFTASCGIKTDLFLEPPDYRGLFTSVDVTDFYHTVQINENAFDGYIIFYRIFDANDIDYDLTDTSENGDIDRFENNFKSSGAMTLTNIDNIIGELPNILGDGVYDISSNYSFGYLHEIIGNTEIPNNENNDQRFVIRSSTGNTLTNETKLLYTNESVAAFTDYELRRHFLDRDTNVQVTKPFNLNSFSGINVNEDPDLPSIENSGTIDFENNTNYELLIAFIGVTYGTSQDAQKFGQRILSEPEFLGTIELNKI